MPRSYPANSRYANLPTARYVTPDGRVVDYLARRIITQPGRFTPLTLHLLDEVQRVDLLAQRYYGDPEQYWRICDANRLFWPPDATAAPGGLLVIPLPLEMADHGDA